MDKFVQSTLNRFISIRTTLCSKLAKEADKLIEVQNSIDKTNMEIEAIDNTIETYKKLNNIVDEPINIESISPEIVGNTTITHPVLTVDNIETVLTTTNQSEDFSGLFPQTNN